MIRHERNVVNGTDHGIKEKWNMTVTVVLSDASNLQQYIL